MTDSIRADRFPKPGIGNGKLAGSGISMIDGVRNIVKHCGVPLVDAVRMASLNPAKAFGIDKRKGSLEPGKDADVVVFDSSFRVKLVVVGGRMVGSKTEP